MQGQTSNSGAAVGEHSTLITKLPWVGLPAGGLPNSACHNAPFSKKISPVHQKKPLLVILRYWRQKKQKYMKRQQFNYIRKFSKNMFLVTLCQPTQTSQSWILKNGVLNLARTWYCHKNCDKYRVLLVIEGFVREITYLDARYHIRGPHFAPSRPISLSCPTHDLSLSLPLSTSWARAQYKTIVRVKVLNQ